MKPLALITGGAGFIGSHTAEALLKAGYRVRVLDCLDPQIYGAGSGFPSYLNKDIECVYGNVRNFDDVISALSGVSYLFHFASLTGVGQSMYDLRNYIDTNVSGTATLIEAIIKSRLSIDRFILSSSRAVYGEGTCKCQNCGIIYPPIRKRSDLELGKFYISCPRCKIQTISVPTEEDRPLDPNSIYGWTKKLQEELCRYAADSFGLPVVILRYFNVYGSRQSLKNPYTGIVSIFLNRMASGKSVSIYEHGTPLRDFVHVSDVVSANLSAMSQELPIGTTLNVGSGTASSIQDIITALSKATGTKATIQDHGEFRIGDIHACIASTSKIKNLLNYEAKITLENGIREFVEWAKTQDIPDDSYQKTVDELRAVGLFGSTQSGIPS